MTAEVLPFLSPVTKAEIEALRGKLGQCEDALLQAGDAIKDLQARLESEKVMKDFYQDLATRRLSRIIELGGQDG